MQDFQINLFQRKMKGNTTREGNRVLRGVDVRCIEVGAQKKFIRSRCYQKPQHLELQHFNTTADTRLSENVNTSNLPDRQAGLNTSTLLLGKCNKF